MHHLTCGNTPTEMVLRGPAKPIAIIIIIAVIIIFITVSRASYYPPPCFLIAKSKVLLCQPYKAGMEPRCHIDMRRAFFIWQSHCSLRLFGRRGFCRVDPKMIHDLNKKAVSRLSVFHASVKSDFILKKGA